MINIVVCVKDRAADAFGRPFFVPSAGLAIRSFSDEINREDKENQMFNHADDFDLFELGTFDDSTGTFECHNQPKLLTLGKTVKV